jgi:polysaccharide pyruvyl transferase CsaB
MTSVRLRQLVCQANQNQNRNNGIKMKRLLELKLKEFSFPPKILIYGGYGFKNVGDEAILAGLLQIIRRCFNESEITVVSGDPQETMMMHNVNSCSPLSIKLYREIKNTDIVILGGGGIVSRVVAYGSKLKFLMPEGKLIHIVGIFSKLLNKKLIYYGVGVTSFPDVLTQMLSGFGFRCADVIVTRDTLSKEIIKNTLGVKKEVIFEQDLSFDTPIISEDISWNLLDKEKIPLKKVLIAITWRFVENKYVNDVSLDRLCSIIDDISDKYGDDVSFLYIPMSRRESKLGEIGKDDMAVYQEIQKKLKHKNNLNLIKGKYHPVCVKGIISVCDLLIGMRLHSVIFAYLTDTPFIAIEYDEKMTMFLKSINCHTSHLKVENLSNEIISEKIETILLEKGIKKASKDVLKKKAIG